MLNKYRALVLLPSIFSLFYISCAQAEYNGQVNPEAWYKFKREKQRIYAETHTLERAPLPHTISGGDMIIVDLSKLAWGAYNAQGKLVKWGNASGGRGYCPDINKACRSLTGTYTFYRKQGSSCKSNQFPVGRGGAPMPYCMHFNGGYALHGSPAVPDFNASHGCIRVPVNEARWLNENFVKVARTRIKISYGVHGVDEDYAMD